MENITSTADAQGAKANHTKGEWLYSDNKDLQVREEFTCGEIHTASKIIAHVSVNKFGMLKGESKANAQRIVKCANMHDELIEKLIEARNTIVTINNCITEKGAVRITKTQDTIIEEIDSLLKQAEQK